MSSFFSRIKPEILINNVKNTLFRFPLPFLFGLAYTFFAVKLAHNGFYGKEYYIIINSLIVSIAGIPLTTALTLFIERGGFKLIYKLFSNIVVILLFATLYIFIPQDLNLIFIYSTLIVTFGFHCFVAFAPYIKTGTNLDFWNFNKSIFLRTLTSSLYSFVIYIGLSLAILAINQLFKIDFYKEIYGDLFFVVSGVFSTIMILSGIPKTFEVDEAEFQYPQGLKIFTVYILLPLIILYLTILYVYGFKILFLTELPTGWVSYLVLSYAVFGIFAFLLVYPIMKLPENKTINIFSKYFYYLLIPLIVLLFISIFKRISDYGITENRYYVFLLAIWLCFVSISMIIKKLESIRIIPISLAIFSLLSVVGPWSSFNISKNSQLNRLKEILGKYEMINENKFIKSEKTLAFEDNKDVCSILDYINETHGYKTLKNYFSQNLDTVCSDSVRYSNTSEILNLLGLNYISRWQTDSISDAYFNYSTVNSGSIVNINGYKYLIDINAYLNDYYRKDSVTKFMENYTVDSMTFKSVYYSENNVYSIITAKNDTVNFLLADLVNRLAKLKIVDKYNVADSLMTLRNKSSDATFDLFVKSISGNYISNDSIKNKIEITNLNGYLLIK